jgi:hypothetical protein
VARERGEVSDGLRRVLVFQAVRLAYIAAERLSVAEGREPPDSASSIDASALIGSVLAETGMTEEDLEHGIKVDDVTESGFEQADT